MNKKLFGLFVAGGQGTRMGTEVPKQFLNLCGRPVLEQTIRRFLEAVPDLHIVVVLPKEHIDTWKHICVQDNFDYPQILVAGGITRFHSVKAALARIPDDSIVMIHDGVRPLISTSLINNLLDAAQDNQAVIPVCPVTDTLKALDKDMQDVGTPDPSREGLFGAQTPQIFHAQAIKSAYGQGYDISFTDDASVARRMQIPLTYMLGERYNIKITTPEDLSVAEKLFV